MIAAQNFRLSGIALPKDAPGMLDEVCEHFVEHSEVQRNGNLVLLKSEVGTAGIRLEEGKLLIDLSCTTEETLQVTRTMLAEHLFYFAGEDPFELTWSDPSTLYRPPNLQEARVISAEDVTPRMRRVKFTCDDIEPFVGGDMHLRILVPPKGRTPVWPGLQQNGRIAWPQGEDELVVRAYTIRRVDVERRELWIDFLQHPKPGVATPGADFARDAEPGQIVGLMGPGGGDTPSAESILFVGDESALPAIARIAEEVPAGTRMQAIIEIADGAEEQPLPTSGSLDVRWLHRNDYPAGASGVLVETARAVIDRMDAQTFVWVACEKDDVRAIRSVLKGRGHDRKKMYAAWYWERD
ncbi:DUF2218 domain-containing protein [Pseudorhizobium sp. NPDC055634]